MLQCIASRTAKVSCQYSLDAQFAHRAWPGANQLATDVLSSCIDVRESHTDIGYDIHKYTRWRLFGSDVRPIADALLNYDVSNVYIAAIRHFWQNQTDKFGQCSVVELLIKNESY